MPMFDGTGPNGYGPCTGCGKGKCQQDVVIERQAPAGRGMGRGQGFGGRGRGPGRRGCPFATNISQDKTTIQDKIQALQSEKKQIEQEINALEKELSNNG